MKTMLVSVAVAAFAVPSALARTATTTSSEYYLVPGCHDEKCTVVDKKPTSTTTTIVDNGTFKTKTEAETGIKSTKVCTEN